MAELVSRALSSRSSADSAITVPGRNTAAAPISCSVGTSSGGITPPTTTMMSSRPVLGQRLLQRRHQGQVTGREAADPDDVDVGVDRLLGDLLGGGEQRAHVDVEAHVGERGDDRPSGRGRGRPGPSSRPGCADAGPRASSNARRRVEHLRDELVAVGAGLVACTRPRSYGSRAWCRPYTFSSASEISPTVALARAASTASASRLPPRPSPWPSPDPAAAVSASSVRCTSAASRSARSRSSLAICWR